MYLSLLRFLRTFCIFKGLKMLSPFHQHSMVHILHIHWNYYILFTTNSNISDNFKWMSNYFTTIQKMHCFKLFKFAEMWSMELRIKVIVPTKNNKPFEKINSEYVVWLIQYNDIFWIGRKGTTLLQKKQYFTVSKQSENKQFYLFFNICWLRNLWLFP